MFRTLRSRLIVGLCLLLFMAYLVKTRSDRITMLERIALVEKTVQKEGGKGYLFKHTSRSYEEEIVMKKSDLRPTSSIVKYEPIKYPSSGSNNLLNLPSIYNSLPHLLNHKDVLLTPALHIAKNRNGERFLAFGIPTVRRTKHSYLLKTLESLIEFMSPEDKKEVVLIVFIGERNSEYVSEIRSKVEAKFPSEIEGGLLELIAPSPAFYPELDHLPSTFDDSKERVKWRAKQNLDYAFLMMYAQNRAKYYVQLEDDIVASEYYANIIKSFTIQQENNRWFMLEFSKIGFIGKLFRSSDLSILVQFFLMFYKQKPNDWLLDHIFGVSVCNPEKSGKHCEMEKAKLRIRYKPSLFQHVGKESSLEGKKQNIIDRDFPKSNVFEAHLNPKANIKTTFDEYRSHTAVRGYLGQSFLWAKTPAKDSVMRICFEKPEKLNTFLFKSGNVEHPGDNLRNATIEILTVQQNDELERDDIPSEKTGYPNKYYIEVGSFDNEGIAAGKIPQTLGLIKEMRIRILNDITNNWVIISEFDIK